MAVDPEMPVGVCATCAQTAFTSYGFKKLCVESSVQWQRAAEALSDLDPPADEDKTYYIVYDGQSCSIVHDQTNKAENTSEAFELIHDFSTEIKKHNVRKCSCKFCSKGFLSYERLDEHLHGSLKRVCLECGEVMPRSALAKHLARTHDRFVEFCSICHDIFDDQAELERHTRAKHEYNEECYVCGMGFANARALRAHHYVHSLFHCSSCNKSFDNRRCLKYHQKKCTSHDNKTKKSKFSVFICDYCGVKYDKKPSLRIHIIQKHLHVLPYVCDTCGKRASTLAHLKSHEATHTAKRIVFNCYCGRSMRTELGYQLHQRIHTGEKPYRCEECGDSFLSSSRRLDHVKRKHRSSQEMEHACDQCPARFVRPFELRKHYISAHCTVVDVKPAKKKARGKVL